MHLSGVPPFLKANRAAAANRNIWIAYNSMRHSTQTAAPLSTSGDLQMFNPIFYLATWLIRACGVIVDPCFLRHTEHKSMSA